MNRKITVLHIVEDLNTGGIERVLSTIATGLDPARYRVLVWCTSRGGAIADELISKGLSVEVLGMRSPRDLRFLWNLSLRMRAEKIDILHAHAYTGMTIGRITAIAAGVPVRFAHLHTTPLHIGLKQRLIDGLLSRFTDRIICCSDAVATFAREQEHIPAARLITIHNGSALLPENGEHTPLPSSFSFPDNVRVIGCIASLVPHKGHRYLLEAAEKVLQRFPDTRFVLIGEGPLHRDLEQDARNRRIDTRVIMAGDQNLNVSLMQRMNVSVLPSAEREGLGLALIEAMSCGIPVIGTSIGGIPEVIVHGETGLLVPPKDSAALAEAILSLLSDPAAARRMGENGKERYRKLFSAGRMIRDIDSLYMNAVRAKLPEVSVS